MGILQQVRSDAEFLRNLIHSIRSGNGTRVVRNGFLLTDNELEAALKRLEIMLESRIIPKEYYSMITNKTYYPSREEKRIQSKPLPVAKHSLFAVKNSRKDTKQKRSNIILLRDNATRVTNFFMEHKDDKHYPSGGFAIKVKKGFPDESNSTPKYAVKIYRQNLFSDNEIHGLRISMRAAYCYKQLGREGLSFRYHGKQYMVTEWLSGSSLQNADVAQIQSMPMSRRIVMAISILRELAMLHNQGLLHNDIKPDNMIVNFGQLRFVDLDSVRPKNEIPQHGITPMYTERYLPGPEMSLEATQYPADLYLKFNEKTDLYAMGLTLAHLFQ